MTNDTATIFDSKFFSPEFREWIMTADLEEVYQCVSDHFKEEHGFRPRWMYGRTREEYARYFISVSEAILVDKENAEWEANPLNHPLEVVEPEPYPYEEYDVA